MSAVYYRQQTALATVEMVAMHLQAIGHGQLATRLASLMRECERYKPRVGEKTVVRLIKAISEKAEALRHLPATSPPSAPAWLLSPWRNPCVTM